MLKMSWITAILQWYSQVADLFGNLIVNIRLFDLLARFHYILNLPCIPLLELIYVLNSRRTLYSANIRVNFVSTFRLRTCF